MNGKTLSIKRNCSWFAWEITSQELFFNPSVISSNLLEHSRGCVASNSTGENPGKQAIAVKAWTQVSCTRCCVCWCLSAHESLCNSIHVNKSNTSTVVAIQNIQSQCHLAGSPCRCHIWCSSKRNQLTSCSIANNSGLTKCPLDCVMWEWLRLVQLNREWVNFIHGFDISSVNSPWWLRCRFLLWMHWIQDERKFSKRFVRLGGMKLVRRKYLRRWFWTKWDWLFRSFRSTSSWQLSKPFAMKSLRCFTKTFKLNIQTHMTAVNEWTSAEFIWSINDDTACKLAPLRFNPAKNEWHWFVEVCLGSSTSAENFLIKRLENLSRSTCRTFTSNNKN